MTITPESRPTASTLPLVGGILAFDFANTVTAVGSDDEFDYLVAPSDLLKWGCHAGLIPESAIARDETSEHLGKPLLQEAKAVRRDILKASTALAARRPPDTACLRRLSENYGQYVGWAELHQGTEGFAWRWPASAPAKRRIIGPILCSAIEMLTRMQPSRVKQCQGKSCGWLFYDSSKNNSRRWCQMDVCGNRQKQRRHVERAGAR